MTRRTGVFRMESTPMQASLSCEGCGFQSLLFGGSRRTRLGRPTDSWRAAPPQPNTPSFRLTRSMLLSLVCFVISDSRHRAVTVGVAAGAALCALRLLSLLPECAVPNVTEGARI